ncbi:hypothetical protein F5984_14340 [Rudanella paleaurantiibacter]|uniref:Uncharacterized protein n=1 Tax=Rudanella paleaurantiibacter TaxID=2614655 RepID=A0A7J5TYW4_9BACT|nr:hypothetical protein [Rudanella paleaurantiibacter]KAB7730336.1 hypothetical protein F5984_14340 [Rudanella paleaurantiibacter]
MTTSPRPHSFFIRLLRFVLAVTMTGVVLVTAVGCFFATNWWGTLSIVVTGLGINIVLALLHSWLKHYPRPWAEWREW